MADIDGLSQEQKVAAAATLSGVALVLVILGIIAAVVIVVVILASTTGIFIWKKHMETLDNHAFEGELVSGKSVPVGQEIEAPAWAVERGGTGINPMGNNRDLTRVQSFFSGLKKTFSLARMPSEPNMNLVSDPQITEMTSIADVDEAVEAFDPATSLDFASDGAAGNGDAPIVFSTTGI
jgi:hypothetical protein